MIFLFSFVPLFQKKWRWIIYLFLLLTGETFLERTYCIRLLRVMMLILFISVLKKVEMLTNQVMLVSWGYPPQLSWKWFVDSDESLLWKCGEGGLRQVSNRKLSGNFPTGRSLPSSPREVIQGGGSRRALYFTLMIVPPWGPAGGLCAVALRRRVGFPRLVGYLCMGIVTVSLKSGWEMRSKAERSIWYPELGGNWW